MTDARSARSPGDGLPRRLADRDPCLVATLQLARTGDVARLFAGAGFDALVLDLEHHLMPSDSVIEISRAALEHDMLPLVRLSDASPGPIRQALSSGALGVVVPRVETAAMAREIVSASRFPPLGTRPVPPSFPHLLFRQTTQADAVRLLAERTVVVAIIETRTGLANCDSIAAVDGIDVLFVGMSDLSFDMAAGGDKDDPALWHGLQLVCDACRRHGKCAGVGGIGALAHFARAKAAGVRYFSAAHDAALLATAAADRARTLRRLA
jgi:2-keto-3-deoxy-L-rhamnonate aldolase RhmA